MSLTWLFTGKVDEFHESPGAELSPEEICLLDAYRCMNRMDQAALLRLAVAVVRPVKCNETT